MYASLIAPQSTGSPDRLVNTTSGSQLVCQSASQRPKNHRKPLLSRPVAIEKIDSVHRPFFKV